MDDLISDFVIETNENLDHLHADLIALEKNANTEHLIKIFRFFHTVKGSCGFLNFTNLEKLTHHAEGLLSTLREKDVSIDDRYASLIIESVNCVKCAIDKIEHSGSEPKDTYDELIKLLDAASAGNIQSSPKCSIHKSVTTTHNTDVVLLPLNNAFKKLPSVIDDLNNKLNKKITLNIQGTHLMLPATIVQKLKAPLLHMVRNAADHGIETPEERSESGKKGKGTINIEALTNNNHTVIKIYDDGRGIDEQSIKDEIIKRELAPTKTVASMSPQDILNFIFSSGVSSSDSISNISGRGVGMDIALAEVEELGGSIEIENAHGKGCCFTIKIPD